MAENCEHNWELTTEEGEFDYFYCSKCLAYARLNRDKKEFQVAHSVQK